MPGRDHMTAREIIDQTMKNMDLLYQDVGETLKIFEGKLKNAGLTPLGDAACTWDVSTAYYYPQKWLYRWFARVYYKPEQATKAVGVCLHLGAYEQEWVDNLAALGVNLPAVSVSLIEFPKEVVEWRKGVLDSFWSAGWIYTKNTSVEGNLVRSEITENALGKAVTYFVDFLALKGKAPVEQLLTAPILRMFSGEETCVNQLLLPVIPLQAI
jgi:hypothetical protein